MERILLYFLFSSALSAFGAPIISEFMADNVSALQDDKGHYNDWIELHNQDSEAQALGGWALTDDPDDLQKWLFPEEASLPGGGYLVVYASGLNLRGPVPSNYHTSFSLAASGEYLALVNAAGEIVDEFEGKYPIQFPNISYGVSGGGKGFFIKATPGGVNASLTEPPLKKVTFSTDRGTFFNSLEIELAHEDPEAEIRYTLDGSIPTSSAALYQGPFTIKSTTRLRARPFKDGTVPGELASKVFLQLGEDMRDFETNLALCFLDSFGMNVDGQTEDSEFYEAAVVFIDSDDSAFGMAVPDGDVDWSGRIGLRLRGHSSRAYAKKQYGFESWDEFNRDTAVSIFGMPKESDWIIYAPYVDKTLMRNYLAYNWFRRMGQYAVRTKYVEVFYNPSTGKPITRSDYRGVYVFMERIKRDGDRIDIEPLLPRHDSEPDISGGYIFRKDRNDPNKITIRTEREGHSLQVIEPEFTLTNKQEAWLTDYLNAFEDSLHGENSDDPEIGFRKYINVANAVDNHILVEITKNIDGFHVSNYVYKDRGDKLRYVPWDYNLSLGNGAFSDWWKPEGWYHELLSPDGYPWYGRMFEDPEFALAYADRWFALRRDMFGTAALMEEIDGITDFLNDAADRNFVKWDRLGAFDWPNPPGFQDRKTYRSEVNFMKDWLKTRVEWIDSQFEIPVKFTPQGGRLEAGESLKIEETIVPDKPRPGAIYYTLNGSDPRSWGGVPNPDAIVYDDEVVLTESATVKARLQLDTGDWSALNQATFIVGQAAAASSLRITEIMYNPAVPTVAELEAGFANNDDFEYLELLNVSDEPIQLVGARFIGGVKFDFSEGERLALEAGQRGVLVANREAFHTRYGNAVPVIGVFSSGRLANGGETLKLLAADGFSVIAEFAYDDDEEAGWNQLADGSGHSLVLVDEADLLSDYGEPSVWTQSAALGGSPGTAEGENPVVLDPYFRITDITVTRNELTITFNSEAAVTYEVQVSRNLIDFEAAGDVQSDGLSTSHTFPHDAAYGYVRVAKKK